jgi:transposase
MPVLTDVQWSAIEPLIEAVRPQTGRELTNLRRTFEAIVWRMQNGAKWRAIPAELGPWWMAAQTFLRWSKLGVWERFFEAAKAAGSPALGMVFMDSTIIRAHQKAAGATKRGTTQPSHRAPTTKHSAAARAASAQRLTLLPMRVAAFWALPSRRGRQARHHKAPTLKPRPSGLSACRSRLGGRGSRLLISRGAHGRLGIRLQTGHSDPAQRRARPLPGLDLCEPGAGRAHVEPAEGMAGDRDPL